MARLGQDAKRLTLPCPTKHGALLRNVRPGDMTMSRTAGLPLLLPLTSDRGTPIQRSTVEKIKLCVCGGIIRFSNEDRCEACFSRDTERWHGRSQRVSSYPYLKSDPDDKVPRVQKR